MSKALLKCPFCGGTAKVVFSGSRYGEGWMGFIVVRCQTCGGSSKGSYYHGNPIEIPLEETVGGEDEIKRWNRRR